MVSKPVVKPITMPALLTVATAGVLALQVPPVTLAVSVTVLPIQTPVAPVIAGVAGAAIMVAVTVAGVLHPPARV